LHLPHLGLWLDATRSVKSPERAFVSHAHADHVARHDEVIASVATARFLQARLGGKRTEHLLPFGERRDFDHGDVRYRLTLLPAGHILGSAMALVEAGGESLLYTGDFKLRPGLAAELCRPQPADLLVMETTFGRPEYCFPPSPGVWDAVVRFCRETLAGGGTPVLLGYSLGKSQELLLGLAGSQLPLAVHPQIQKLTVEYEHLGRSFPPYELLDADTPHGRVVLCPPSAVRSPWRQRLEPIRSAVVTGWALDPRCRYRYGVDAAFPLSDHADFPDLLQMVEQVAPRQVFTCHGFAADFAATLRERGISAWALSEADQLTLPLTWPAARA
jgi:Cft2 family RNA processing exonuclease